MPERVRTKERTHGGRIDARMLALLCVLPLFFACARPAETPPSPVPTETIAPSETPAPTATPAVVQLTERHILSNVRRTLHNRERSAFTSTELEMILFVELKGRAVSDIGELSYLPNIETLTIKNTSIQDLSPLAGCERMHTLVLLENDSLDFCTLPHLPRLRTLSISGKCSEEELQYLKVLLPNCGITKN